MRKTNERKFHHWWHYRSAVYLVLTSLILVAWVPAAQQGHLNAPIHPQLLAMAVQQPETTVRVIVQETAGHGEIEALISTLDGEVIKNLSIIDALAVRLPAGEIPQLAAHPGVRWISPDGPVESTGKPGGGGGSDSPSVNTYLDTLNVQSVWNMGRRGEGVTVAVIDSGISNDTDFDGSTETSGGNRLIKQIKLNPNAASGQDATGHGTHVAGIIGGNGSDSAGAHPGVAPYVNLISLRVSNDAGLAYESDVVTALQWVYDNKSAYNIRVINLSLNSTVEQSYHTSPLNAAVEILWFNGVVVVASAGNKGAGSTYNTVRAAPANDPFIITVGAMDEKGSSNIKKHSPAPYSAFGTTSDGFAKPDIMAPGSNIISVLSSQSTWDNQYPERSLLDGEYFRLSGTSMAAPMVTGAVALLLQDEPTLTPDQVKYRLLNTGSKMVDPGSGTNTPYLNVYNAVTGNTTQSANTGLVASQLLWSGTEPVTWNSVSWNSVSWNSVSWNSVSWNSVSWNSVSWTE